MRSPFWCQAVALTMLGCAAAPPVAVTDPRVGGLLEPAQAYREMGFFAHGPPVAFAGALRFLAGPDPDSTLAVLSIAIPNSSLEFQRAGGLFHAAYGVDGAFRVGTFTARVVSEDTVRVSTFHESRYTGESLVFQRLLVLPPGEVAVDLTVRDRTSSRLGHDARTLRVPRFEASALSSIIPVYQGTGRADRAAQPDFIVNPRAALPIAADTLVLYVEAYGGADTTITFRALDESGSEVWRAVTALSGAESLRRAVVRVVQGALPAGRLRVEAVRAGAADTASAPLAVGYADLTVVATFEGTLHLLRYHAATESLQAIGAVAPQERSAAWLRFWKETDPYPVTPQHEGLMRYFGRVTTANAQFAEPERAGWLTDRGEVHIRFGEPEEIIQVAPGPITCVPSCPTVSWRYRSPALLLVFVYDSRLKRYRLDAVSKAELQRFLEGKVQ